MINILLTLRGIIYVCVYTTADLQLPRSLSVTSNQSFFTSPVVFVAMNLY